ncbi:MAG: 50S ribosomal protein L24e [Candidatus Hermodarchaeota archaeon]
MVRIYECSFCGKEISPGTGSTYVQRTGAVMRFCSSKCRKSKITWKRDPRKLKWTKFYEPKLR